MGSEKEESLASLDGCRLQAAGAGEEPRADDVDPSEWKLVNSRLDNRYGYFSELPWPAARLPGAYEWTASDALAYVHALGERQKAFEVDVRAKLKELESLLYSTGEE